MKEHNVIGTMQLLAACQKAPGLERLVVKSSSAVYGCRSRDPAMFTEDMDAKRLPRSGYAKDVLEVEGYVRGFARRRPDVAVTMLRTANVDRPADADARSRSTSGCPVVPTVLGFDAALQFLHEDDLLGALHHATLGGVHGTFNVAGDGVLMLSQALRRLGRPTIPVPGVRAGRRLGPSCARPGSPTSRRADRASSPSVAGWTPPGCAPCSGSSPATPPRRRSPTSARSLAPGLLAAAARVVRPVLAGVARPSGRCARG